MRKCTGGDTREWGFEAIFELPCPHCAQPVEFFKDEISRRCPLCGRMVSNDRKDYGCNNWCSADQPYPRNRCPKFVRAKARFYGHF